MSVKATPTKAFLRDLKRIGRGTRQDDAITALELFIVNPFASALNFEQVRSRKGYFSIRANYHDRIILRSIGPSAYEAVAVGNHDYVYVSFFRRK